MGCNEPDKPEPQDRPSTEILLNNVSLSCENCGMVQPTGLVSLRPRKEARFICERCLQLHIDKIRDMKK